MLCLNPLKVFVKQCDFSGATYPFDRPQYMVLAVFYDACTSGTMQTHPNISHAGVPPNQTPFRVLQSEKGSRQKVNIMTYWTKNDRQANFLPQSFSKA